MLFVCDVTRNIMCGMLTLTLMLEIFLCDVTRNIVYGMLMLIIILVRDVTRNIM